MAILEIKSYPETVLKMKALPVENINGDLYHLINNMVETMYDASGIGLAAPQVGVLQRVIVIDVGAKEERGRPLVLINPRITETDGLIDSKEGCLSIPGYSASIKRAEKVVVKGLDREGKIAEIKANGLLAKVLQHEIDHLDGLLIIDRLEPTVERNSLKWFFSCLSRKIQVKDS
ncbi:peptide deformylase [Thermodesulfovibrionales bacterium]|nr:peptide deformylase [Thermodesulfovibrionales bacterium]MCL0051782.1 peptide deformylase [Thermodesulfovibrionales bacterium]MCL0062499.1 peptide deformylase [Thermodesulfovibrionales bacterium]MCL0069006.1 peptide deformylase [Thermodesulfovibrionales bacterium]MCL0072560.1 peptide deformylase [Thermodesulfovibrionales bacterium]